MKCPGGIFFDYSGHLGVINLMLRKISLEWGVMFDIIMLS